MLGEVWVHPRTKEIVDAIIERARNNIDAGLEFDTGSNPLAVLRSLGLSPTDYRKLPSAKRSQRFII